MVEEMEREQQADGAAAASVDGPRSWEAFPPGLRLELVYATPPPGRRYEDLAEPFVSLGDRGRFSRALAARVSGPIGGEVRALALKMQSDDYPIGSLPGWSNADVDAQWDEQYALVRAAAATGAAPAVVDVLPAGIDGGVPRLPPTLFCKLRRAFFAAPCPLCGGELHVCRDDTLLEANGLPRYDGSLERFLYCSACSGKPDHRFYTLMLADPNLRQRAPVGEQTDLFRALGRLAREGGALPCHGCSNEPTCYPAGGGGDAVRYLTPLSFYDFRCSAAERLDLHYDELIAAIGGKDGVIAPSEGQRRAHTRHFLFEHDPRGRLLLEILRLKLLAFTQVVAAVSALHRATRRPHLSLSPENIMVRLDPPGYGLPVLYRFAIRLLGIGTNLHRTLEGLDDTRLAVPLLIAPAFRDNTFASSLLAASAAAQEGTLVISALSKGEREETIIEGELRSDAFDVSALTPKDALHINVRQGRPLPVTVELLANPTRVDAAVVRLRSAAVRADATQLGQLEALVGQGPVRAAFAVYPCLHVPCDIESLGILLFTTLAANSEQGPAAVGKAARALGKWLVEYQQSHPAIGEEELAGVARAELQRAGSEGPWALRHLLHDPKRFPEQPSGSLEGYWRAALVLALRALTRAPGFGFCRAHDDFDPLHPDGPADHLLSELAILAHSIDEELLVLQGRRREIGEAIRRVRQRLAGGPTDAPGR